MKKFIPAIFLISIGVFAILAMPQPMQAQEHFTVSIEDPVPLNPNPGDPVELTATSNVNVGDPNNEGGLLRIYIYEIVMVEGEDGDDVEIIIETVGSCGTGDICQKTSISDVETIRTFYAEVSKRSGTQKVVKAESDRIDVEWSRAVLTLSVDKPNPKIDKIVTLTATSDETVQGTDYTIRIYELVQGGEPETICVNSVSTICSTIETSDAEAEKTYIADVSKTTNGKKVVWAKSEPKTVTWTASGPAGTPTGPPSTSAPSSKLLSLQNPLGSATFEELIAKLIDWLLVVTLPIIVLLILYAGFLFMISGVSPDQRKNAVNIVKYALIGYAIMLLAKVLVGVVMGFFL